jgi:DUF2905 family protein
MEAAAIVSRWAYYNWRRCRTGCDRWLGKLGLGRLSGDIAIARGYFTFYFAIVTCLIVSIILSFIFWLMNR